MMPLHLLIPAVIFLKNIKKPNKKMTEKMKCMIVKLNSWSQFICVTEQNYVFVFFTF